VTVVALVKHLRYLSDEVSEQIARRKESAPAVRRWIADVARRVSIG
jgi:hypothetical protein